MPAVHPAFLFSLHGLLIADSSAPRAGDCCSPPPCLSPMRTHRPLPNLPHVGSQM
ncbi:hypothetical protein BD779DRAFT_1567228 [Infundibulicybe gibba]|nr:hypothetical protein BD779DRAFT_1567228 [Infundibulicybe gibba]